MRNLRMLLPREPAALGSLVASVMPVLVLLGRDPGRRGRGRRSRGGGQHRRRLRRARARRRRAPSARAERRACSVTRARAPRGLAAPRSGRAAARRCAAPPSARTRARAGAARRRSRRAAAPGRTAASGPSAAASAGTRAGAWRDVLGKPHRRRRRGDAVLVDPGDLRAQPRARSARRGRGRRSRPRASPRLRAGERDRLVLAGCLLTRASTGPGTGSRSSAASGAARAEHNRRVERARDAGQLERAAAHARRAPAASACATSASTRSRVGEARERADLGVGAARVADP